MASEGASLLVLPGVTNAGMGSQISVLAAAFTMLS
jgi:hypothetical protein